VKKTVNLDGMDKRHRALTPAIAGSYKEAASVCFSRHHSPPTELTLSDNGIETTAEVSWITPNERVLDAWANTTDTTEAGAYGCVIAGVELLRDVFAIRRAETGTGADYYIGPDGSGHENLEDCVRLEVSGVGEGDAKEVRKRLLDKVKQASAGNSNLPAMAGVVGFSARLLIVKDVLEES
jgi:hypothetical protein